MFGREEGITKLRDPAIREFHKYIIGWLKPGDTDREEICLYVQC